MSKAKKASNQGSNVSAPKVKKEKDLTIKVLVLRVRDVTADFLSRAASTSGKTSREFVIDSAILAAEQTVGDTAPTAEPVTKRTGGVAAAARKAGLTTAQFRKQAVEIATRMALQSGAN